MKTLNKLASMVYTLIILCVFFFQWVNFHFNLRKEMLLFGLKITSQNINCHKNVSVLETEGMPIWEIAGQVVVYDCDVVL